MPEATRGLSGYASEASGGAAGSRSPVDILVVDDNPAKLLALEAALAPLGENVVRAGSGREALMHLLTREFATVILDVNMPDLDGFETARMIRSRPCSAATPIIFISAINIDETDARQGYSLGAVDYICAPIVPEVIRAKVSVFVELHRKSEEARTQAERLRERTRELERSQRELRLSERMASIGTLCAGLGHDMGNLLLPISIWIDTLQVESLPEDIRDGVQSMRTCVQYLRKLASGLRLVSLDPTHDASESQVVLGKWVDEVGPILRNALPRGVQLKVELAEGVGPVYIAPHRLAQAAFNLVQNAGEALRGRKDAEVRLWAEPEGDGVRIGVSDNGPGMSPDVLAHCLDPFFTTKTRGISTGLGLALVHGIVQAAGARLDVNSAPGQGTTFSFVLMSARPRSAARSVAVVSLGDARSRALALALVRSSGCEPVSEVAVDHEGPAIWVTDPTDGIAERAESFMRGRADRRVFVLSDGPVEVGGACPVTLTGSGGLAVQIRRFFAGLGPGRPQSQAEVTVTLREHVIGAAAE